MATLLTILAIVLAFFVGLGILVMLVQGLCQLVQELDDSHTTLEED